MRQLANTLTQAELAQLFTGFQQSAFRYEGLQDYRSAEDDIDFAAFQAGGPVTPNQPWCDFVTAATAGGKHIQRIRIVREPLTDYTRWELARLAFSAQAGEEVLVDIRQAPRPHTGEPDYYCGDFWLFDAATPHPTPRLVRMAYDISDNGRYLGAYNASNPAHIDELITLREQLLETAIPLADYLTITDNLAVTTADIVTT